MDKNEKTVETTVFDYLRWRGDLTFAQDTFNEVDNLILCIIAYLNFRRFPELTAREPEKAVLLGDIVPRMTAEDEQQGLSPNDYIPLMRLAAESRRFSGVRMLGYEAVRDEEKEMQLDAVSFLVPDGTLFCAFMGTDRSLVGWKENLNLSFMDAVPAQLEAVAYVEDMARHCPSRPLRIGGHSKGGNLAAYAAMHIDPELQRTRLLDAYNNDGPGFRKDVTDTEEYRRIAQKLHTYIPASSIVGVLLEHTEDYAVVASSSRAVMQHEPLTWGVQGRQFIRREERSELGKASDDVLRQWIASMTREEREEFSAALFDMFTQGGKLRSLEEVKQKDLLRRLAADEKQKGIVSEVMRRLMTDVKDEFLRSAEEGLKGTAETLKETAETLKETAGNLYQAGQKALEKRK